MEAGGFDGLVEVREQEYSLETGRPSEDVAHRPLGLTEEELDPSFLTASEDISERFRARGVDIVDAARVEHEQQIGLLSPASS